MWMYNFLAMVIILKMLLISNTWASLKIDRKITQATC
jgi:hypothetical protein